MLLLIDNFDSFTYNIVHAFLALGMQVKVVRNNEPLETALTPFPTHLVIGPGPGTPQDAGISQPVFFHAKGKIPILGICLGHQLIGSLYGARITRALKPCHGKVHPIYHTKQGIFHNLPSPFQATRYHSLTVDPSQLSPTCIPLAHTAQNELMALHIPHLSITGVQFHPESITSEYGSLLLKNFLETS